VLIKVYEGRHVARSGSGFVVQSDKYNGYVLTNAALVQGKSTLTVVAPSTGAELVAQVAEVDSSIDVALLKVNGLNVSPLVFSAGPPETGDVVWSVLKWSSDSSSLGLSRGNLRNVYKLRANDVGVLSHTAIVGEGGQGSVLLNDCAEVIGFNMPRVGADASLRAVDADSLRRLMAKQNVGVTRASAPCVSEMMQAREQAARASEQAKKASEEATRARQAAQDLEKRLQQSNERNEVLRAQADAARTRAEEAMRTAEVAHKNADDTRLELERKTASIHAETEAMMKYMEQDRAASEARFKEALKKQRDEASTREQTLFGFVLLFFVVMVIGLVLVRNRSGTTSVAAVKADIGGQAPVAGNHTEMHKQELVEYVLDGRDEDGIRYLLRISGDQMVNPEGVIIGRNPQDSPYIINHADVSRKHARMKVMKNRVFIEDLGSTNGTSVNGQSIDDKGPVSITNGDQIIIGSVVMKLRVLGA
jgi:hypothetical protein